MKKVYCDICGKEITHEDGFTMPAMGYAGFEVNIIPPLDFSVKDVCEKCRFNKFYEIIQGLAQSWR